jgi:hypothetical protein
MTEEGVRKWKVDDSEKMLENLGSRCFKEYERMKLNEIKSLLSLEGLRHPLSRDSSTYTLAMSYFAWLFYRWRCVRC